MSLVPIWSPFFQSTTRMRGRAYQLAGRVKLVEATNGEVVRAEVRGTDRYLVTLRIEDDAAVAECTCPHFEGGSFCKHIWATLLAIQTHAPETAEALVGLRVRAPKARKRDGAAARRAPAEPEWMSRLTLLRASASENRRDQGVLRAAQRCVCFVVLPRLSRRHHGLAVEVRHQVAAPSGHIRSKPMKVTDETLATLVDPVDRELCALLLGATWVSEHESADMYRTDRPHATFRLPSGAALAVLRRMVDAGRCFVEPDDEDDQRAADLVPLSWDGEEPWDLWMIGREGENELVVDVELRRDGKRMPVDAPTLVLGGSDGLVIYDGRVAPFDDQDAYRWVSQFREDFRADGGAKAMRVPAGDVQRFLDRLYMLPQLPQVDLPAGLGRDQRRVNPAPHLDLFSPGSREAMDVLPASTKSQLSARVWFAYEDRRVNPNQPGRFVPVTPEENHVEPDPAEDETLDERDGDEVPEPTNDAPPTNGSSPAIRRDVKQERAAMALLAALGVRQPSHVSMPDDMLLVPVKQMPVIVSTLLDHGWVVSADQKTLRRPGPPRLAVTSGIDWFELHGGVMYRRADGSEYEVPLPQVLAAARAGQTMIQLDDGSHGLVPDQWLVEHGLLTAMGRVEGDHLRFRTSQAALLDALLGEHELVQIDERFRQLRERLATFAGIEPLDPHRDFHGKLRAYQRDGLGWLRFLRWFGMGGILADDMGLGKTIQVLAMLQARKHHAAENDTDPDAARADEPSLIVVPRSVVFNWIDEAARFTPDLRVLAYSGTNRDVLRDAFGHHDIIVTSYGLLRRDVEELTNHQFDYVVLDEAQAIKNPGSQAAKSARLLHARHRLALTGTPIENHLGDLWSIFEYLNPGMLGSSARFAELVKTGPGGASPRNGRAAGAKPTKTETLGQIASALRPFILRRTKQQVLADLPPKTEQTIVCEMEPPQRKVYDELREYYRGVLMRQLDAPKGILGAPQRGLGKAAFMVLEALLRLRQAACHPALIDKVRDDQPSAKLDALLDMLADVIDEDSKALVFSQFTSMLAIVRKRLDERGIKYSYLDGQTRDRKKVVESFQNDSQIPVFLISLKAGGFGLNLTAAEYVFILDPWWNPAVESQAIDRTHRIGQTKPVFAYRLICEDTVEQRIAELQQRKKKLAEAIVGGEDNLIRSLTRDDLEMLLS